MALTGSLAKSIRRTADVAWVDVKWMEPMGRHGLWVVSLHGHKEQLARERSLTVALWKAWRKVRRGERTDCR